MTITPALHVQDYFPILSNPTSENIQRYTREGRVATYQKLAMLKTRLSVEQALARDCERLRALPDARGAGAGAGADRGDRPPPAKPRRPSFRRVEARAGGALDWATPATIGEFPDLDGRRDYHYDGSDFDDDGL